MQLVVVEGVEPAEVVRAVDARTYARGLLYVQRRDVVTTEWDAAECALYAMVRDGRTFREVVAYFEPHGARLKFLLGECTCAVGANCAHVVASVLATAGTAATARKAAAAAGAPARWERTLRSLFAPEPPSLSAMREPVPLAIELSLSACRAGASALSARIVRPGRTGWVAGGMTWHRLEYSTRDCRPAHVRVLKELYALSTAGGGVSGYYYGRNDRTIDLGGVGRGLWSVLDEAAEVGLQVVHAHKRRGAVDLDGRAELCLDVTAGAGPEALEIAPVLRFHGAVDADPDALPVLFLGTTGHGVVHVSRAQADAEPDPARWRFRLARLTTPAPPPLRRLVVDDGGLSVPGDQRQRFLAEFYPRLSRLAPLASSDASFTPPVLAAPELVLRADFGDDHALTLEWGWAYAGARFPFPHAGADEGVRDPAQERAVLDALDLPPWADGLLRADGPGSPLLPRVRLGGLDTMRVSTEVLPLLTDAPGVVVERSGSPAAYREAGDLLQVGVSTTESADGGTDWFDLGVRVTVAGREVPFGEVFAALAAGESHLLLPDGAYFSLQKPELQALRALIEEARALQESPSGPLRLSRFQAGLWEELAALGVVDAQARAWQQQVAGLLAVANRRDETSSLERERPDTRRAPVSSPGLTGTALPTGFRAQLRPYQRDGFDWLCFLWRHGLGGVLADDMGLGKTVQALALICHAREVAPAGAPFLIVAPTSVLPNWAAEAARFSPQLRVVTITDTLRRRGQELAKVVAGADVVVTSYTLFRLDADAYGGAPWSGLFLDEAQFAKNHQTKVHQCARRLPAPFKLAITGTPMENNLMELWSLLSITAPGLFPSPTRFREMYARPIERDRPDQPAAELLARLRRRIRPLVRRRTKEQVAPELPAKQEQVLTVELDARHRRIYERHLQRERQKVLGLIDDVDRNRFTILRSITLLRRLSLHAGLVAAEHADVRSAKIDALLEQLAEVIGGGHRALVFSQFTGFLAQVRAQLDAAGVGYCYLDGASRDRAAIVQRFRDGAAPVFLISLKAGGFGMNLTEADYCFLLDPWWNPATEAQAVDRTHRIGQTRNVMVYRMIARDTIEEKVLALARRKAALFAGVMNEGNVFGAALDADDIRALVS
jgi:superfamily II DNA or RNA helicase